MGLICRLGGHKADAAGTRWNGSICFGQCVRCRADLVRTVRTSWQVPRGYRVVWRDAAKEEPQPVASAQPEWPEPAPAPAMAPEWEQPWEPGEAHVEKAVPRAEFAHQIQDDQAVSPGEEGADAADPLCANEQTRTEWPLGTSSALEQNDVRPEDAAATSLPAAAEPADHVVRFTVPDFMDDEPDDVDWDDSVGRLRQSAGG